MHESLDHLNIHAQIAAGKIKAGLTKPVWLGTEASRDRTMCFDIWQWDRLQESGRPLFMELEKDKGLYIA